VNSYSSEIIAKVRYANRQCAMRCGFVCFDHPGEHLDEAENFENPDACILAGGPYFARAIRGERFASVRRLGARLPRRRQGWNFDLTEAKAAASALFDKLDVDHDGTLDRKELTDRISAEDWKIADPDNDKTISKDEYLAFVEVAFKRANPDNDATIDAKELKTPAGRALVRLLMK
jgi:hypothetical protein